MISETTSGGGSGVAAIILAAGRSTRMGANKLLLPIGGKSLIERIVDAALASRAAPIIVVLGHEGDAVRRQLASRPVHFVLNRAFAEGLSTSIRAGLAALPETATGAIICLGDMPDVSGTLIDRLIDAFDPESDHDIIAPVAEGRRGNPVLLGRRHFAAMAALKGDQGARGLIVENADRVLAIETGDSGALIDIDTPDALAAYTASASRLTN